MTVTITPFTIDLIDGPKLFPSRRKKEEQAPAIIYWGIYLNNEQVSYTSSRELAEKTKLWMEKWLKDEI